MIDANHLEMRLINHQIIEVTKGLFGTAPRNSFLHIL
jgi:hypothetical protein